MLTKKISIRTPLSHVMGWLLLLSFFNTIIDTRDIDILSSKASYNEMESIAEWVMEDMMDMDDAVPEHDENDAEKKLTQTSLDWEDFFPGIEQSMISYKQKHIPLPLINDRLSPLKKVITPPPDVYCL